MNEYLIENKPIIIILMYGIFGWQNRCILYFVACIDELEKNQMLNSVLLSKKDVSQATLYKM